MINVSKFVILFSNVILGGFGAIAPNAYAQGDLFGCQSKKINPNPSSLLYELDEIDGSTISTVSITLDGNNVNGCNGLATNPITGDIWILVKVGGGGGSGDVGVRTLATIDTSTGAATSVGVLGDAFAGIAFDPAGTLYGVTGDGANTPETLYTLDKTDASSTFVLALGNGSDGEAIAIDNKCVLHHGSGVNDGFRFYERIDLVTLNFLFSGQQSGPAINDELASMVFNPSTQRILASERVVQIGGSSEFLDFTASGAATKIGETDRPMKGLAFTDPFAGLSTDADCDGDLDIGAVSGQIISINTAALLIAGLQSTTLMIPVIASIAGIGFIILRKKF